MKNQLFIIILGLLFITGCSTQNRLPEGISKANGEHFQITHTTPDENLVVISNVKNKYEKGGPGSDNPNALPMRREDIHFDVPAANAIILQVLTLKYEKLHKSEGFIHVDLIFEGSGELSDITFAVMKDTPISLEDLAKIDTRLRNTLSATYTGQEYQHHKIFIYNLGTTFF